MENGAISLPLLFEVCEFVDLQLRHGVQLALHIGAVMPLKTPEKIGASGHDAHR